MPRVCVVGGHAVGKGRSGSGLLLTAVSTTSISLRPQDGALDERQCRSSPDAVV